MSEFTKELNLNEKIALVSGTDQMYTNPIPSKGIPSVSMADGPHGLRKQTLEREIGIFDSEKATAFPTSGTTANGWSRFNFSKVGEAIAQECLSYGVDLLLGPGVNIKRNPLCGRNFEYFSEDPYLAAECGISFVNAVQSMNVGVTLKHFALNDSENYRAVSDSVCDERTMREIYLKPFEKIVKNSNPCSVMSAYNKINGVYCCENASLLNGILRNEWGFEGTVMTDWGAMRNRVKSLEAGVDLEMPGDAPVSRKQLLDAVKRGELNESVLDASAERVIKIGKKYKNNEWRVVDFKQHHELAGDIAKESAVLMKNDGTLPLNGSEKLCVVGDLFCKMRYQGAGSSTITPTFITTPKDAFDKNGVQYEYARGYDESSDAPDSTLEAEAAQKAENADVVLLFIGLTDYEESEGRDRTNMRLAANQERLVNRMIGLGKKTVCVLFGGSVVSLPFSGRIDALLNMFLPGQNGGTATYQLLFGKANPCGRLAQTWMKNYEDVPFYSEYSCSDREVYKEGLFVGYRYYLSANVPTAFPFGFGLSYTTFDYGNVAYLRRNGKRINVSCDIVNTGNMKGKETVQLYVSKPDGNVVRPRRELKGFRQVNLNPGEKRKVEISITEDDLAFYDVRKKAWVVEGGRYALEICRNSEEVNAVVYVDVKGETVEKEYGEEVFEIYSKAAMDKVTDEVYEKMSGISLARAETTNKLSLDSRFSDFKRTFFGRMIYKAVSSVLEKGNKKIRAMEDGEEKNRALKGILFRQISVDNSSLIQMSMSQPHTLPYNCARALVRLGNGNVFGALFELMKKVKGTPLPKDEIYNKE